MGKVEHRLLDRSPRRIRVPVHDLHRPHRSVQADPFDGHDPPAMRNGHVYRLGGLVGEPM